MGGSVCRICRTVSGHASSQTIQYLSSLSKSRLGKKLKNQDVIDLLTPAEARKLAKMAGNPFERDDECQRMREVDGSGEEEKRICRV